MPHDAERAYREIKISGSPSGYDKFMRLLRTVQQDSSLAHVIREVTITASIDQSTFDKDMPWIITNPDLHEFLFHVASYSPIEQVTISAMYEWTRFPRRLQQALITMFLGKNIQLISLSYLVSVPKDCFLHIAKRTRELNLSHVEIIASETRALDRGAQSLTDLVIEDMDSDSIGELFDAMTPYIAPTRNRTIRNRCFPHLVDLTIGPTDEEQLPACSQLVQASSMTLQILRWEYPNSQFPGMFSLTSLQSSVLILLSELPISTSPISLAEHGHLKKIIYMVPDINDAQVYHPHPFEGLIRLLHTINPERNSFAELDLKLICPHFSKARDSLHNYDGWTQLASVLRNDRLRYLQKFNVHILVTDPRTRSEIQHGADRLKVPLLPRKAALMEALQHRLPILAHYNMLSLELAVPGIMGSITV
ncbi:hypothetical protein H0H87_008798 [Tephrocybe sp. NHM501043]|nr:hypothetical protein H0H87_008798 [Tephrocybe sp. NHM501043]